MRKMKYFDDLEIYIDRLKNNKEEPIYKNIHGDLLEINEQELKLVDEIKIKGKAYIASDFLIINFFTVQGRILMPCSICNELKSIDIKINNFYHSEPLDKIKNNKFNFKDVLKEAIFLEIPSFLECNNNCEKRKDLNKYINKNNND